MHLGVQPIFPLTTTVHTNSYAAKFLYNKAAQKTHEAQTPSAQHIAAPAALRYESAGSAESDKL